MGSKTVDRVIKVLAVHPVHKIQRLEDDMGGAVAKWCLQLVAYLAGRRE